MDKCFLSLLSSVIMLSSTYVMADDCCDEDCPPCPPPRCEDLLGGTPIAEHQCPAAYNRPASISLGCPEESSCDFFAEASYTYWYAGQQGMQLAQSTRVSGGVSLYNSTDTLLVQPFEYKSGFEVAAGVESDGWVLLGKYTWVRNKTSQNTAPPAVTAALGTGAWFAGPWYLEGTDANQGLAGTALSSTWDLKMNIADLVLGYAHYQGRNFIVSPFGGLRGAWIDQSLNFELTQVSGIVTNARTTPLASNNSSKCWSVGPRMGLEGDVLLGAGFRFEGTLATDLLYTRYTSIKHQETTPSTASTFSTLTLNLNNQSAIQPVFETGLGMGWGAYFGDNQWHFDLSADYNFMYWWNQNVMRELVEASWNSGGTYGDLYLHGLTVTARFDF